MVYSHHLLITNLFTIINVVSITYSLTDAMDSRGSDYQTVYKTEQMSDNDENSTNKKNETLNDAFEGINSRFNHWIITENGLTYCPINCLLYKDQHYYNLYQQLLKSQQEQANESQENETALVFNKSQSVITTNENNQKTTAIDTRHGTIHKNGKNIERVSQTKLSKTTSSDEFKLQTMLECLPYVNKTEYDDFLAIQDRYSLKNKGEPELISTFQKNMRFTMDEIKAKLIKMKQEKPYSAHVYSRIAIFFRIQGNSLQAVECLRKALYIEPYNSDTIMSLARFLYHLEYYDDALEITRRSLDHVKPDQIPYIQHYTFGQILYAYGYVQQALLHLQYAVKIQPNYEPAVQLLQEVENSTKERFTYKQLTLIFALVSLLLFMIVPIAYEFLKKDSQDLSKKKLQKSNTNETKCYVKPIENGRSTINCDVIKDHSPSKSSTSSGASNDAYFSSTSNQNSYSKKRYHSNRSSLSSLNPSKPAKAKRT